MLATLVTKTFSAEGWIFEPKLDGERCLTFRQGKRPRLLSRNRTLRNQTHPALLGPLARQATDSDITDGEMVAFQGDVTGFSQLQRRMAGPRSRRGATLGRGGLLSSFRPAVPKRLHVR